MSNKWGALQHEVFFSYPGDIVWVFEGYESALGADYSDVDMLLVNEAMLPSASSRVAVKVNFLNVRNSFRIIPRVSLSVATS